MRLAGKVAVITGAGSGIGRAAALLFAAEGAAVVAGVYEPDGPEPLPPPIAAVSCDVTRDEDTARLIGAAVDRHGGLDILVNNAGIESPGTVTETTDEQWQRLIDVNLKGQFLCARHAVPFMLARGKGSIVNNASINGIRGNHRLVAYSASKGGVVAMTMAMALDYAPRGIRVNCVCPAAIENTRMDAISAARAPDPRQRMEYLLAKHPIGAPRPARGCRLRHAVSGQRRVVIHHRRRASRGWRQIHPVMISETRCWGAASNPWECR